MANFNVTKDTDDGTGTDSGSLSWAIRQANDVAGDDTITLATDVNINGAMSQFINSDVTIEGKGFTIDGDSSDDTDADGDFRPLFIRSGTVAIQNLSIVNGLAQGVSSFSGGSAGMGGGVFIYDGDVTFTKVEFKDNKAQGGSGVSNDGGSNLLPINDGADGYSYLSGDGGNGSDGGFGGNGGDGGFGGDGFDATGGNGGNGGDGGFGGNGGEGGFGGNGDDSDGYGYGGNGGNGGNGGFGGGGGSGGNGGDGTGSEGGYGGNGGNGGDGGFGGGGGSGGGVGIGSSSGGYGYSGYGYGGYGGYGGYYGSDGGSGGYSSYIGGSYSGGGGGGAGMGGAIFIRSGRLNLDGVKFLNNTAIGGTGVFSGTYGDGQGLGGALFALHTTDNGNGNNQGMPNALPLVMVSSSSTFVDNDAVNAANDNDQTGIGDDLNNDAVFGTTMECFLTGTLIATDQGEVPVETLKRGDRVKTADGDYQPVKWLGHQTFDQASHHPRPFRTYPVCIKAGALGHSLPNRDLYVSPDHALLIGSLLINAGALTNDRSIVQVPMETFVYHHVELEQHGLLLAEGIPAESYLPQNQDRNTFDNVEEYAALYPNDNSPWKLPMSFARVSSKQQLPRFIRQHLLQIARTLPNAEVLTMV